MSNVKHIRGSKVKYDQGTIVTTEKGRRAQVQADGRWRWLPSNKSELGVNSAPSLKVKSQQEPTKRRKVDLVTEKTKEPLEPLALPLDVSKAPLKVKVKKRKRNPLAQQQEDCKKQKAPLKKEKGYLSSFLPSFLL